MIKSSSFGSSSKSTTLATSAPTQEMKETKPDFAIKREESKTMPLKQQLFCREYILDFNATQAAIRSGYSEKTARQQGTRLLTNVDIQSCVQKIINERMAGLNVNADWVLKRLSHEAMNASSDSARVKALELLGKYFNLWQDQFQVPIDNRGRVVFMMPEKGR